MGGEGDEGEGDSGGPSRFSGSNSRHGPSGSNDSSTLGDSHSVQASRSHKRKAPSGKKMSDAQSISSVGSSARESPPITSGPIIKVEGDSSEATDTNINKGTLKAAIIQRSLSKPRSESDVFQTPFGTNGRPASMQHHHSFSEQNLMSNVNMTIPSVQRPSTAGSMGPLSTANLPSQQAQSPPRFAFNAEGNNLNPNMTAQGPFLSPQTWGAASSHVAVRPSSAMPITGASSAGDLTYGDLARGSHHLSPTPPMNMPSQAGAQGLSPQPVPIQHPPGANAMTPPQLLPIAHPILRDHPQYEAYISRLRQQQTLGQSKDAPVPPVRTAPSSPNFWNPGGLSADHPASTPHSPLQLPPSNESKRSASVSSAHRLAHEQPPNFLNPFPPHNRDEEMDLRAARTSAQHVQASKVPHDPQLHQQDFGQLDDYSSYTGHSSTIPPPPYASSDAMDIGTGSAHSETPPISNAAFNDLMGSILGDMNPNHVQSSSENESHVVDSNIGAGTDIKRRQEVKDDDDMLQSLSGDNPLAGIVGSESVDALKASSGVHKSPSREKGGPIDGNVQTVSETHNDG